MLPGRLKIQFIAFFVLSGGVAANLFLLQKSGRAPAVKSVTELQNRLAGGGETSSIGATSVDGSNAEIRPRFINSATGRSGNGAATTEDVDDPAEVTRAIQRELSGRGYQLGAADGVTGPLTRGAIMAFEYDHGLALTGQPTNALLKQILLGAGPKATNRGRAIRVQSAEARAVIQSVQGLLTKLGYRPGPINGRLMPRTSRAIRRFERDQALPVSGRISGLLISRLARIAAKRRVASGR